MESLMNMSTWKYGTTLSLCAYTISRSCLSSS